MTRPSVLPNGMKLVGDVQGDDDLIVLGTVEGEVSIGGAVVVEEGGTVRGNVQAKTVAIRGVVLGDAHATESIRVDEGGRMVGDVHAPRVNIVRGAKFRGHVHMLGEGGDARGRSQPPRSERLVRRGRPSRHPEAATLPGSVAAPKRTRAPEAEAEPRDTVLGGPAVVERRPPAPAMPALRRARGRRRDARS